jgi:hypothetical protein
MLSQKQMPKREMFLCLKRFCIKPKGIRMCHAPTVLLKIKEDFVFYQYNFQHLVIILLFPSSSSTS